MPTKSKADKWRIYESEKQHIFITAQSSEEHERLISELCKRLGI